MAKNKEGVNPADYAVKPTMKHKANSPGYGGKTKETGPGIHVLPMPAESTNSLNAYGRRADKRHSGKGPAAWNDGRPKATMDQNTGGPAPRMPNKVQPAECKKRYQGKKVE